MVEITRREVIVSGAAATLLVQSGGSLALAQATAGGSAERPLWDLTEIFPTDSAWESKREQLMAQIGQLQRFRGTLGQSSQSLLTAAQAMSDVNRETARLYAYASLKADEDLRNSANQERRQKAQEVYTALGEATSWVDPEIVALGEARMTALLDGDPRLAKFRMSIDQVLRLAPHTLTPSEEKILASASTPLAGPRTSASSWFPPTSPGRP